MTDSEQTYREDFKDSRLEGWQRIGGVWEVDEGCLLQRASHSIYMIISPVRLEEGTLRSRLRLDGVDGRDSSVGLILRFPGDKGYTLLRFGSYQGVHLVQPDGDVRISDFSLQNGRFYDVKVQIADATVTIEVDGSPIGSQTIGEPKGAGTIGLCAENQAAFDHIEVTGKWRKLPPPVHEPAGTPDLDLDFVEWQLMRPQPAVNYRNPGAVCAYYRNVGSGSATVGKITFASQQIDPCNPPDWVAYVRQQPYRVAPGEVGMLEVRLKTLPRSLSTSVLDTAGTSAVVPLVIHPDGGRPLHTEVNVARPPVLQINFMGFSEDLKKIYVYVQNNEAPMAPEAGPIEIGQVHLNGTDVTAWARFGDKSVFRDVVPIEITLDEPLAGARPVQVIVTTLDGRRTGHVLRACPSRFNIIVTVNPPMARKDYMEDLYYHGVTALFSFHDPKKVEALGLEMLAMGQQVLAHTLRRRNRPICAFWIDEIDKPTKDASASRMVRRLEESQEVLDGFGEALPPVFFNLVFPSASAVNGYMTVPDAVMHSYGHFMCPAVDRGFGRVSALASREYRQARRPFWPYFRDSEIAVPVDPERKTMRPRHQAFQRCLVPAEQRWLTFGCLIQGAKSMAHWGYRAIRTVDHYFIRGGQSALRLGLGGPADGKVGPYALEPEVAKMLKDVWDEHGRINCELRTLGPLIAKSDVSYLARVTKVNPPVEPFGAPVTEVAPAAEAAALVCGLDALVIVVLNHNIHFGKFYNERTGPLSNPQPPRYDPLEVTVEVRIPSWLKPRHIFSVNHEQIAEVSPRQEENRIEFLIPRLEVSQLYVITSSAEVKQDCLQRHQQMRKLLEKMVKTTAVADPDWKDIDAWRLLRSPLLDS